MGYVIGPNKIESVDFDIIKEDGSVADTSSVDITPTLAGKCSLMYRSLEGTDIEVNDESPADIVLHNYTR